MDFTIIEKDNNSKARVSEMKTAHGKIMCPVFMPVGTLGSVKAIHQKELEEVVHAQIILGNAYHLYLRPGLDVIESAGGLHKFMGWNRPLLTDSGGYQVFSLAQNRKISDEGVSFQSHIDGSRHFISPEKSMDIQRSLGADIIMAFDECTPFPAEKSYAKKSMELTHRWLLRCEEHLGHNPVKYGFGQFLFPIVQGSVFEDLRKESALFVAEREAAGNAIGGLSVGEPAEIMYEMTDLVTDLLPSSKPRYLMGVGTPENILESIARGVDMFDCVIPTRNARHGILYTREGIINIRNEKWKFDHTPLNEDPLSFIDLYYTKSYLRHLVISGEILAAQIATLNNLVFYHWLMDEARKKIMEGTFVAWKNELAEKLSQKR